MTGISGEFINELRVNGTVTWSNTYGFPGLISS